MNDLKSIEEAFEAFKEPSRDEHARHIGDVSIDAIQVNVMDCGLPILNEYMLLKDGRGEMVVVGGRPGMGKSALMFQMGVRVAKERPVLIFSLEMCELTIKTRMLAGLTGFAVDKLQRGIAPREKLEAANEELKKLNLYIDERSSLDIDGIRSAAVDFARKRPLALCIIDYLQLVPSSGSNPRHEEVANISRNIKLLAQELKCPILVGSQLNRTSTQRGQTTGDYRPSLADLRESGAIEQDADIVVLVHRPEAITQGTRPGIAELGIVKNRNGKAGWEEVKWLGAKTCFLDPSDAI